MPSQPTNHAPDVYVACLNDAHGWGGAVIASGGLAAACESRGLRATILGVGSNAERCPTPSPNTKRLNLRGSAARGLWRIQSWLQAGVLTRRLRGLPPPRLALIANSPFWVVAAKRAWPRVPVVYRLPCLLANCLPFTWQGHKPPDFWTRVNYAGVCHADHLAFDLADRVVTTIPAHETELRRFHPNLRCDVTHTILGFRRFAIDDELRAAHRSKLSVADDEFLIGALGVCDLNKGFDILIHALAKLDPCSKLFIAGDGPELGRLRRLASDLGVAQRVHLAGAQHNLAPWYAAADCVVCTSHYEAFSNTIGEAMTCGRPVVVPHHNPPNVYSGLGDFVAREGGGLLYDRLDLGSLVEALSRVAGDRELADRLVQRGQQLARQKCGWDAWFDEILPGLVPAVAADPAVS